MRAGSEVAPSEPASPRSSMDRAPDSSPAGCGFKSRRGHQYHNAVQRHQYPRASAQYAAAAAYCGLRSWAVSSVGQACPFWAAFSRRLNLARCAASDFSEPSAGGSSYVSLWDAVSAAPYATRFGTMCACVRLDRLPHPPPWRNWQRNALVMRRLGVRVPSAAHDWPCKAAMSLSAGSGTSGSATGGSSFQYANTRFTSMIARSCWPSMHLE